MSWQILKRTLANLKKCIAPYIQHKGNGFQYQQQFKSNIPVYPGILKLVIMDMMAYIYIFSVLRYIKCLFLSWQFSGDHCHVWALYIKRTVCATVINVCLINSWNRFCTKFKISRPMNIRKTLGMITGK